MSVHVSVIQDLKAVYPTLEIVDWCLSGVSWIMNRYTDVPKVINHSTWKRISPAMIAAFQAEYDTFLRGFDLFILAHPSVFALAFEKYGKPILMLNTTRYDLPYCYSQDLKGRQEYTACLQRLSAAGRLHIVSNNRADQLYLKTGTGLDSQLIPSLCLYTGVQYAPTKPQFLLYHGTLPETHPLIAARQERHAWSDITSYRGLISVPYETSLMSLFEYFTAGMPLFVPSKTYWAANQSLCSVSWYWGATLPEDLAPFKDLSLWMELSDIYSSLQSPNTKYFDSMEHLVHLLETFDYVDDRAFRQARADSIKTEWKRIFQRIQSDAFWTQSPRHLCYNRLPLLANVVFDINYGGSGVAPQHAYPTRTPLCNGDVVFVKTEYLEWVLQRQPLPDSITLVTGVSDVSPSTEICKAICANPKIRQWIGCNLPISHPKVVKLPISVGEPERENGNHDVLVRLHANRIPWDEKHDDVCVPYHGETHASRSLPSTLPKLPYEDYMQELSRHRFVVCQRGNGLDTHRVCEVLLMGSVPVLESSPLDDLYAQFNCLIVDSFDSIDTSAFTWDDAKAEAFLDVFWLRDGLRERLLPPTACRVANTGQIQLSQEMGQWISKYASDRRFTRYLEIGTWNGRGSTCCFYDGFSRRTDTPLLQSYEVHPERVAEASRCWMDVPSIRVIHGRVLQDEPTPEEVDALFPDRVRTWHAEDLLNCKTCPYVAPEDPEVVLLDGAEYLTQFEFDRVFREMPSVRVYLLDDTMVAKTQRIVAYLLAQPDWVRVAYSDTQRNGWAVFERTLSGNATDTDPGAYTESADST
jgi:hypothetical protein